MTISQETKKFVSIVQGSLTDTNPYMMIIPVYGDDHHYSHVSANKYEKSIIVI